MTDLQQQAMFQMGNIHVFNEEGTEKTYPLSQIKDWSDYGLLEQFFPLHVPHQANGELKL